MSTTVGNGLTVDGTVKASQATQAGEAVVLGDDGMIPANLMASGGKMNVVSYSSWSSVLADVKSGTIPIYATAYILFYYKPKYCTIKVNALSDSSSSEICMPAEGMIYTNAYSYIVSISETSIFYFNGTKTTFINLSDGTIQYIKVVWSD